MFEITHVGVAKAIATLHKKKNKTDQEKYELAVVRINYMILKKVAHGLTTFLIDPDKNRILLKPKYLKELKAELSYNGYDLAYNSTKGMFTAFLKGV